MTFHLLPILAVASGGALGAGARFYLSSLIGQHGILIVNLIGCFLIGALVSFLALKSSLSHTAQLFLIVGLLGGFTTFSAFSLETIAMIDTHKYGQAAFYIAASVGGGLCAFILGRMIVKTIL